MGSWTEIILIAGAVSGGTFVVGLLCYFVLGRLEILDIPIETSSHEKPVVTGGGWAILIGWFIIWLVMGEGNMSILGALIIVATISFFDDVKSLPIWPRLGIQIVASGIIGWYLLGQNVAVLPLCLACFWIVGMINAANFFDGLHGLLTVNTILAAAFGAAICFLSDTDSAAEIWFVFVAAAAIGFLPHNFPKPRLFLGDVGSTTIGFVMGGITVAVWFKIGPLAAVAVVIPQLGLILDTSITVLRRAFAHKVWLHPHRGFFFHRLMRSGLSHTRVTLTEAAIQLGAGALAIAATLIGTWWAVGGAFGIALIIWICFFVFCEKRFRKSGEPN